MKRNFWVVLVSLALLAVGCSRIGTRPDAQVASDVQNKINGDSNIPDKQLNINANNGVVTLTGTVASDAARNAAANDAAQVEGVKTVVNNLEVAPTSAAADQNAQPQNQQSQGNFNPPPPVREARRPSPSTRTHSSHSSSSTSGAATMACAPRCRQTAALAAAMIRLPTRHPLRLRRPCRRRLLCRQERS